MPWIPVFMDDGDAATELRWLNEEKEIAFLLGDGPKRWKAVQTVDHLTDGRYGLWQHTGEPLLLLRPVRPDEVITDPWRGWQEQHTGADPTTPYFGAGHPSVFWLNLKTCHCRSSPAEKVGRGVLGASLTQDPELLPVSSFEWIGDRYGKAPQSTHRCWNRLKQWINRSAERLPAPGQNFWAFPSALAKLRDGMDYHANGFDLSEALGLVGR